MKDVKIFDAEFKFMNIVWDNAPINSSELVKLAEDELGWKKSTTCTIIRRLRERGIIKSEDAIVSTLTLVGLLTLGLESKYIGKKAALYRNAVAFLFSLIVAFIIGNILGG